MIATGIEAEKKLADFLYEPLLIDFVHLNPEYTEGEKRRELCDLLIEDDELAIPIQLKFQDREKASSSRNEKKWAEKKIKKALNQLLGAIKNIEKLKIQTNHPFRGRIEFPSNYFKCKQGLVIIDYKSDPFKLDQTILRRTKKGVPIHYFTYEDFITLCQKLMTLPDLLEYLEERSKIPAWATPLIGEEKNAYAYYLNHKGKFNSYLILDDFKNQWNDLITKHNEKFKEKEFEDENAQIFNKILRVLSIEEPILIDESAMNIQKVTDLRDKNRLTISRKLNKIRRIQRREICKIIIKKIEKAETSEQGFNYFAFRTNDPDTIFLFLASRHSRQERIDQLKFISDCVNNINNPKYVIGIATESLNVGKGRSYDFLYMEDMPPIENPNVVEMCKQFIGEMNISFECDFPSEKRDRFSI